MTDALGDKDGGATQPSVHAFVQSMRLHQWTKNLLVVVPAVMGHSSPTSALFTQLLASFVSFGLVASSAYVVNDILDVESDRRHPTKRFRALASGRMSVRNAVILAVTLLVLGFLLSGTVLPIGHTAMIGGYLVLSLTYSFWLKRKLLVDVFLLAGLYTWRILAGGVAVGVDVSEWLMAMSVFGFTSLAFVKRYIELSQTPVEGVERMRGRGYVAADVGLLGVAGMVSGYLTVLVLALYLNGETVRALYARPRLLWLICPLLLYWFTRIWFLAARGRVDDDPLVFVLSDRVSMLVTATIAVIGVAAAVGP